MRKAIMTEKRKQKDQTQMAKAVLIPLDNKVNRNSKDSVFCDLFSDPQYILQLYKVLHPEDDINYIGHTGKPNSALTV